MPRLYDRITTLEERLKQLKNKHQRQEARRRGLEIHRARRDDTRRKILVGAIVLAKIEQGAFEDALLRQWLDEGLTRPDDRELFELARKSLDAAGPSTGD
jgi:hypothetical protein